MKILQRVMHARNSGTKRLISRPKWADGDGTDGVKVESDRKLARFAAETPLKYYSRGRAGAAIANLHGHWRPSSNLERARSGRAATAVLTVH
jgi:hypothetical protein